MKPDPEAELKRIIVRVGLHVRALELCAGKRRTAAARRHRRAVFRLLGVKL